MSWSIRSTVIEVHKVTALIISILVPDMSAILYVQLPSGDRDEE